jgi:UDP-3-O-[3-hydroxymyristoyl] glucosamine N-acyltransferase
MCTHGITLIADKIKIGANVRVGREMMIEQDILGGRCDE